MSFGSTEDRVRKEEEAGRGVSEEEQKQESVGRGARRGAFRLEKLVQAAVGGGRTID